MRGIEKGKEHRMRSKKDEKREERKRTEKNKREEVYLMYMIQEEGIY